MTHQKKSEMDHIDTDPTLVEKSELSIQEKKDPTLMETSAAPIQKKEKANNNSFLFKIISILVLYLLGIYLFTRDGSHLSNLTGTQKEKCSIAFPGKPLKQYVLMIDAGSSGSRIHVYRFNYCKESPEIEDEVFEQLKPGLSDYVNNPEDAAKSLDRLLQVALKSVPTELHHCTPISVKATAGLRKHKEKRDAVLKAVRDRLHKKYPFPIIDKEHGVEIMDGSNEGVYAWITVNYLLGRLNSDSEKGSSVATIDLGGGSVQIVFEPQFKLSKQMENGNHKFELEFSGKKHELYQHSYLGYGLNEARENSHNFIIDEYKRNLSEEPESYEHPCLKLDQKLKFKSGSGKELTAIGKASSFDSCHKLIKKLFLKDKACPLNPCSFNGVYQPSLKETFGNNDIYAFSFFYDRTQPFGLKSSFKVKEIKELAQHVCHLNKEYFDKNEDALAQLENKPYRCFDITYLYTLLNTGFDIEDDRVIRTAKKIRHLETGWCLGASIAVLDDRNYCSA